MCVCVQPVAVARRRLHSNRNMLNIFNLALLHASAFLFSFLFVSFQFGSYRTTRVGIVFNFLHMHSAHRATRMGRLVGHAFIWAICDTRALPLCPSNIQIIIVLLLVVPYKRQHNRISSTVKTHELVEYDVLHAACVYAFSHSSNDAVQQSTYECWLLAYNFVLFGTANGIRWAWLTWPIFVQLHEDIELLKPSPNLSPTTEQGKGWNRVIWMPFNKLIFRTPKKNVVPLSILMANFGSDHRLRNVARVPGAKDCWCKMQNDPIFKSGGDSLLLRGCRRIEDSDLGSFCILPSKIHFVLPPSNLILMAN